MYYIQTLTRYYFLTGEDNGELEAGEQTVYACSGSSLVLKCGENNTGHENEVSRKAYQAITMVSLRY